MSDKPAIYIASKVLHADRWKALRAAGVPIVSTWIDEAGEGMTSSYKELSQRCIDEIRRCSSLVLYCEESEILKGALIEAGIALALGKDVLCVGSSMSLSRVFKEHSNWLSVSSVKIALTIAGVRVPAAIWKEEGDLGVATENGKAVAS